MLGNTAASLDIGDLPIVPGNMRATSIFAAMRSTIRTVKLRGFLGWTPRVGQGWELAWRVLHVNRHALTVQVALAAVTAMLFYAPAYFLRKVVLYLENDPQRKNTSWGWFYSIGLFVATAIVHIRQYLLLSPRSLTSNIMYSPSFRSTLVPLDHDPSSSYPGPTQHYSLRQDTCSEGRRVFIRIRRILYR